MAQVVFGNFEYGGEIDPFPLTQFGWKSSFKELVEKGMGLPQLERDLLHCNALFLKFGRNQHLNCVVQGFAELSPNFGDGRGQAAAA